MPWSETDAMQQRVQFIRDWLARRESVVDLCARYGISRKSGYKWIDRYMKDGPDWAMERSHVAAAVHNRTAPEVEQALLQMRHRHPTWGARKLLHQVALEEPLLLGPLPHPSTVCDLLKRHGLVTPRPRRRPIGHPGRPSLLVTGPNDCWSADFKGQFRTADGVLCYPLTVTDNYSRFLLGCQALDGPKLEPSRVVFTRLFREYGLPRRIRTDNGVPFAAKTLGRLSQLSVWFLKLGILHELIEPGSPQQNGRHERMHRTLKQETVLPPAGNARAQQRRFNAFRAEFNDVRPHEALDMNTPSQIYTHSLRPMPTKLLPPEYPDRFEQRLVSGNGGIRWKKGWVNVTTTLVGEHIGLEPVDDGLWDVYYGVKKLGRFHERLMRIEDTQGHLRRPP